MVDGQFDLWQSAENCKLLAVNDWFRKNQTRDGCPKCLISNLL